MGKMTLFLTALGLSMDACAVSISNGMCYYNISKRQIIITATAFGLFQALMPVIGYFIGLLFSHAIQALDHWIALILLGFIGGKMIFDAIKELREPEVCLTNTRTLTFNMLIIQAIATSIDALAVGISLAVMQVDIISAAFYIGVITFICCILGSYLGKCFGKMFKQKAEIFGGAILIFIFVKIFLEHTIL